MIPLTKAAYKNILKIKNNSTYRKKEGKVFIQGEHNVLEIAKNRPNLLDTIVVNENYGFPLELNNLKHVSFSINKIQAKKLSFNKKTIRMAALVNLAKVNSARMPNLLKGIYVGLINVQDPFNLGTIFRTAEAFGVKGIFLFDNCVNPFNQKVVISSTGSVFRVPFYTVDSAVEFIKKHEDAFFYGTSLENSQDYRESKIDNGIILFGNEGNGVPIKVLELTKQNLYIPIKSESLNLGVSVGVILSHILP